MYSGSMDSGGRGIMLRVDTLLCKKTEVIHNIIIIFTACFVCPTSTMN